MRSIYIPNGYDANYGEYKNAAFPTLFDHEMGYYLSINSVWQMLDAELVLTDMCFIIKNPYADDKMHQDYE